MTDLIEQWDKDKDGALSEEEFYEFYKVNTMSKPRVVLMNFKTLGYNPDFSLKAAEESCCEEDLARHYILKDGDLIQSMFETISSCNSTGELFWELYSRLPPIDTIV